MVAGVVGGLFSIRKLFSATRALKRGLFGKLAFLFVRQKKSWVDSGSGSLPSE